MDYNTDRKNTYYFTAIVFLFAVGLTLLIYKNYDQYYQDQIATSNEIASTPTISHQPATATSTKQSVKKLAADAGVWKQYVDSENGFGFGYPSNTQLTDVVDHNIGLLVQGNVIISVKVWPINTSGLTEFDNFSKRNYNQLNIGNDSIQKKVLSSTGGSEVDTYIRSNEYDYLVAIGGTYSNEDLNLYNKILSTFKFTK